MKNSCAVIIISVICNIFLCIIKTIIGIFTNSQAMIADGLHSLEDVSSSIISLIGNNIASKDNELYPFGIKRVKYVFSLTVSILMIMISITMLKNVISNISQPSVYIFSIYSLIVCCVTITIKTILYIFTKYQYVKTNNILVKSIMCDHRNDIIITIGIIISIIATRYNLYILDYIAGIVISLLIAHTGIKIYWESYNTLMCKKIINSEINNIFGDDIDVLNMGEEYIVIVYVNKNKMFDFKSLCNDKNVLEKYNVSQLLIRYR